MGKAGHVYRPRCGFCLGPQHFPDTPNQSQFPSTVLKPGDQYRQTSAFEFYVLDSGLAKLNVHKQKGVNHENIFS